MIPFKLFALMSASVRHLDAADELRGAHAAAFGAAISSGAKDAKSKIKSYERKLMQTAFPVVSR